MGTELTLDQSQKDPADAHTLSIREEDYPPKFQGVIRRLIKAISEPDVRETMEVEDDYLEEMEDMERVIAKKETVIAEQAALIEKAIALLVAGGMSEADARARLSHQ